MHIKSIIWLLTLGIQCKLSVGKGECDVLPVCCHFQGRKELYPWHDTYHLNMSDFQNGLDRCEAVSFGKYFLDNDVPMITENMDALRLIADSGKPIYLLVNAGSEDSWKDVLNPQEDHVKTVDEQIDTLVNFVINFNVSLAILDNIGLYNENRPGADDQIISFIGKVKKKMNTLKFGLYVDGLDFRSFANLNAFNFTATNAVIENYFVDMTISNMCSAITQIEGVNPLESKNKDLITLTQQSKAANDSAMAKCKVYAVLQVPTVVSDSLGGLYKFDSYSRVCLEDKEGLNVQRYCLDSVNTLYRQAVFVKDYFSGLMLSMIEGDDFNRNCGCKKYPVSNSLISGWFWETNPQPEICEKIDEIDKKNANVNN